MLKKKPTVRSLKKELKDATLTITYWRERTTVSNAEVLRLKTLIQEKPDLTMMHERRQIATALGQMAGAVTEAIRYVIGKEVL